jgi:hypothetical protein
MVSNFALWLLKIFVPTGTSFKIVLGDIVSICIKINFFWARPWAGKPYWRGTLSTVELFVLTSFKQLHLTMKILFTSLQNQNLNEEVNCTKPFPSVRVPCHKLHHFLQVFCVLYISDECIMLPSHVIIPPLNTSINPK